MKASEWLKKIHEYAGDDIEREGWHSIVSDLAACEARVEMLVNNIGVHMDTIREQEHKLHESEVAREAAEARVKSLQDSLEQARDALVREAGKVKELREALVEMCESLVCRCDEAYTGRGLHAHDCLKWIGDIGRAALGEEGEK